MAKGPLYSRLFGKQEKQLTKIASTDKIMVSVLNKTTGKYETRLSTLKRIVDNITTTIQLGDSFSIVKGAPNGGIIGTGLKDAPLEINPEWIDKQYYRRGNFPISQIGNSSDFALPISGSYLSVSPVYGTDLFQDAPFVEANGELRVLRHVTNGELQRVVYTLYPNYRSTPATETNIRKTDIIYTPPGLASGEYIHNVFIPSTTAMFAEIWNNNGFKEYAFITLNGTLNHESHTFIRLKSADVFNAFRVTTIADERRFRKLSRQRSISAVIHQGKKYLFFGYSNNEIVNTYMSMKYAEVTENGGVITPTGPFKTNFKGGVITETDTVCLYKVMNSSGSTDPNYPYSAFDTKPIELEDPGANISPPGGASGWTSGLTVAGTLPNGRLLIVFNTGISLRTGDLSGMCRATRMYEYNLGTKNMYQSPKWLNGQSEVSIKDKRYQFPDVTWHVAGYSTTMVLAISVLGDGSFFRQLATVDNAYRRSFNAYVADGVDTLLKSTDAGINNPLGSNPIRQRLVYVEVPAPTVLQSNVTAFVLPGYLKSNNENPSNGYPSNVTKRFKTIVPGMNSSSPPATYNVLQPDPEGASISMKGYPLSADRKELTEMLNGKSVPLTPHTVTVVNGANETSVHHTAAWTKYHKPGEPYSANFDANGVHRDTYDMAQSVFDKLNAFCESQPIPSGWTGIHFYNWAFTPPHPTHGPKIGFLRVWISFKKTEGNTTSYKPFDNRVSLIDVTVTKTTTGYRIDNVNTNSVKWYLLENRAVIYVAGSERAHYTHASAMLYDPGKNRLSWAVRNGDWVQRSDGLGNMGQGRDGTCLIWDLAKRELLYQTGVYSNTNRINDQTLLPAYAGKGYWGLSTNTTGGGAFYSMYVVNPVDGKVTSNIVVGSSRPPAGFSFTISAPINVSMLGKSYTIPIGVHDLTKISSNPKNKTFYLIAIVNAKGELELRIQTDVPTQDGPRYYYIGYIKTTEFEISEINAKPSVRWDNKRPSSEIMGSSILVRN